MPALPQPLPDGTLAAQNSFQNILGRALGKSSLAPEAQARQAAESYIALTFIQPIIKQLRESDHTPPPWGPTQGEKQFGALRDAELAQRIAQAKRFPLVDRVARDLLVKASRQQAADTPAPLAPTDPDAHADADADNPAHSRR
jgi:Rod binding domain-containing protein